MNALVTGGAGYIGSNLCDALLERGYTVSVIDNLSTGSLSNIAHLQGDPRFRFVRGCILDSPELPELVRRADKVFHLAAAVGVKYICDDPLTGMIVNIRGTERVMEHAARYGKRTVIASSSEVYGKSNGTPLREDAERVLGPTHINRWSYSISKAIDEHVAYAYAAQGMPVSIVRYFNSYGPRISENGYGSVVAQFTRQALAGEPITVHGNGQQTRSFTFVADTVRGTILANEVPEAIGDVFNVGSEYEVTILELARMVRDLTGSRSEIVYEPHWKYYGESYEDTARRRPDTTKSARILGFRASTPLREGLKRTIEWCREHYAAARVSRPEPVFAPIAEPIAA
ncbi:MAG: GDP-mannose 4,6-dehydratase [Armatimonadota bacterium]